MAFTKKIMPALAAVACLGVSPALAEGTVTVLSPGGTVFAGGKAALWGPAGEALGIAVKEETTDEGLPAVRLQVGAGNVTADIVFLADYEGELGGREGILEPLDYSVIDRSKFLPGTTSDYCVGVYGYATVMAWNTKTYSGEQPKTWQDFFDVEKFPGRRAMRSNAETQIEAALLGDGVPAAELYDVMATDEGLERALNKIRALKPHIAVWWSSGAQHGQFMKDGEIDMTTGWNGRFEFARKEGGAVDYTFNQGILATDCLAVPKGAPNKDLAMKMIAEMSNARSQAEMSKYTNYGPVIPEAFSIGVIDSEAAKVLPTNPEYSDGLIIQNIGWWLDNNDRVKAMYEDMMTE
nr:ABC transporter substrate-binding protein [Shinella pollutisoli]